MNQSQSASIQNAQTCLFTSSFGVKVNHGTTAQCQQQSTPMVATAMRAQQTPSMNIGDSSFKSNFMIPQTSSSAFNNQLKMNLANASQNKYSAIGSMNAQGVSNMSNFKNSASMSMSMATPSFPTIQHFTPNTTFNRSSVKMSAKATTIAEDIEEEYWEANVKVSNAKQSNDTSNYWEDQMQNRKPICLPKWVDDDGLQVIMNKETRNIGWIGLGETGHSLAFQLVRAGYNVTVYDKDPKKAADLEKFGAKVARTANDVACQSDYLFLCVGSNKSLMNLLENSEYGIYDDIKVGSIVVNHSPRDAEFEADEKNFLRSKHATLLDAPIHAPNDKTHQMKQEVQVGGVESEFNHVQDLLKLYVSKLRYIGDVEVCANEDYPCEV